MLIFTKACLPSLTPVPVIYAVYVLYIHNIQPRSCFVNYKFIKIVAIIHNLFASKIAIKLLGVFGSNVTSIYFKSFALVAVIFSLIYLAFYFLTSRSYYQIVNRGQGE